MDVGGGSNEDHLTVKLQEIIGVNVALELALSIGLHTRTITEEWDFLQTQVTHASSFSSSSSSVAKTLSHPRKDNCTNKKIYVLGGNRHGVIDSSSRPTTTMMLFRFLRSTAAQNRVLRRVTTQTQFYLRNGLVKRQYSARLTHGTTKEKTAYLLHKQKTDKIKRFFMSSCVPHPWQYVPAVLANALFLFLYCFMTELSLGILLELLSPVDIEWSPLRGFVVSVLGLVTAIAYFLLLEWLGEKVCWFGIRRKKDEDWEARQGLLESGQRASVSSKILQMCFMVFTIGVLCVLFWTVFVATVFFMVTQFSTQPAPARGFVNFVALSAIVGSMARVLWAKTDILGLLRVHPPPAADAERGVFVNCPTDDAFTQEYTIPSIRIV